MNLGNITRVLAGLGLTTTRPNPSGWLHISCPFAPWRHKHHVDRSRGFAIKVEDAGRSSYVCKACHVSGRLPDMILSLAVYRNKDYSELAREAEHLELTGVVLPDFEQAFIIDTLPAPLAEDMFGGLFARIADHRVAADYVKSRRISLATCEKLGLEYDKDKRRITFPVRSGAGDLYGWSGRTIIKGHEPRILDYAGLPKRHLILGEDRWRPGFKKILVEGLVGYARMHEIGVEEFFDIGCLLGSDPSAHKMAILKRHEEAVLGFLDPDKAGDECLYGKWIDAPEPYFDGGGLIDLLSADLPVLLPTYPAGLEDIDDFTLAQVLTSANTAKLQGVSKRWLDKKTRGS